MIGGAPARAAGLLIAIVFTVSAGTAAQIGGAPKTGNPTPGTPQPQPPNLADRVTLVGCVQHASQDGTGGEKVSQDTVSDSRYVLTNSARRKAVPIGTGGSKLTARPASRTYRLSAIESQLSPFVGGKVEVSGELKRRTQGEAASPPVLQVEFVQRLASSCP
jgi:hypothetical protein